MGKTPQFIDSKTGEVVKAIVIDSKHSWRDIQRETGFSEEELNFHLAQLFSAGVMIKKKGEYFITPVLEAEWVAYHQKSNTSFLTEKADKSAVNTEGFLVSSSWIW